MCRYKKSSCHYDIFMQVFHHGLTSGCWDAGHLIRATLLHLNVAKVEDASRSTEHGHLLIFLHSKNIHGILRGEERKGERERERELDVYTHTSISI